MKELEKRFEERFDELEERIAKLERIHEEDIQEKEELKRVKRKRGRKVKIFRTGRKRV